MRLIIYILCQVLAIINLTNVRATNETGLTNGYLNNTVNWVKETKRREMQSRLQSDKFCGNTTIKIDYVDDIIMPLGIGDELLSILSNIGTIKGWLESAWRFVGKTRAENCEYEVCGSKLNPSADPCGMVKNFSLGSGNMDETLQTATSITCLCSDPNCRTVPCASIELNPEECARLYKEADCHECYSMAVKVKMNFTDKPQNYSTHLTKGNEIVSAVVKEGCEIRVEESSPSKNVTLQILKPGVNPLTKIDPSMEVIFKCMNTKTPDDSTLRPNEDRQNLTVQIAIGVTASVVVVILLAVGVHLARRRFSTIERRLHEQSIPAIDLDEFFNGKQLVPKHILENSEQENHYVTFDLLTSGNNSSTRPAEIHQQTIDFALSQPYQWKWEIPKKQIMKSSTILGKGEFGEVFVGDLQREGSDKAIESVAIKEGRDHLIKSLLIEIKILSYIGMHENIVNMLGASVSDLRKRKSSSAWLVLELCSNGSMKSFLNSHRFEFDFDKTEEPTKSPEKPNVDEASSEEVLSIRNLYKWSQEIALGMEFLETMKILHIDLAARNVLLDSNCVAKIGDFGSSRKLYSNMEYWKHLNQDGTMDDALAFKWMALESLQKLVFSAKSEVWSYGVTIWEIFTLGSDPYFQVNNYDQLASSLLHGMRLPQPLKADDHIYEIMKRCWDVEPDSRPTFTDLQLFFKEQFEFEELSERL